MRKAHTDTEWEMYDKGVHIKFKSKSMEHSEATYEGVIVKRFEHHLLVYGSPIKETMREPMIFGTPQPYHFSVPRNLTEDEVLYVEEEDLYYASKKAG